MLRPFLIVLFLLLAHVRLHAQQRNLYFHHLDEENGLPQNYTSDILQDEKGYIWIATTDGLVRYDGRDIRHYRHAASDPGSLPNNSISDLSLDHAGRLWIGTLGGGIARYDAPSDRFFAFRHAAGDTASLSNDFIKKLYVGPQGILWIGTEDGLNYQHPDSLLAGRGFYRLSGDRKTRRPLSSPVINTILRDSKGDLWVGTRHGLNHLSGRLPYHAGSVVQQYFSNGPGPHLTEGIVYALHEGPQGRIWVGTTAGLNVLDRSRKAIWHYLYHTDTLRNCIIFDIVTDAQGDRWLGTYGLGLVHVSAREGADSLELNPHFYRHDPANRHSLSDDNIYDLLISRDQVIWAGTETGGVSRADLGNRHFQTYRMRKGGLGNTNKNVISAVHQDVSGDIWIGLENGGMVRWNRTEGTFTHIPAGKSATTLSHSTVMSMTSATNGDVWAGSFGGLNRIDPRTQRITKYAANPADSKALNHRSIFALYTDVSDILWIGTRGGGLNRLDPATGEFSAFRLAPSARRTPADYTWDIAGDQQGRLWLASDGGLLRFDPADGSFEAYVSAPDDPHTLSSNYINCLHVASDTVIWIGTGGAGLNRFNPQTGRVDRFDDRHGLPDPHIYSIVPDRKGRLWLSTNKGLARIDPDRWPRDLEGLARYDVSDGLQDNEFNLGAGMALQSGELLFGGMKGINIFDPDSVRPNTQVPDIRITGIKVLNKALEYDPSAEKQALDGPVDEAQHLQLSWWDNVIEISFAALHYAQPEYNRYAYMLEGFDADWVFPEQRNFVTYTNLDPGTYTFRVKGSNNDGTWNDSGRALTITISPPVWRSTWAYLLYAALAVALVLGFVRYRVRKRERELEVQARLLEAKAEEREAVRRQSAADFHDELGHKLTRISLLTELLRRQLADDTDVQAQLDKIHSNAQSLNTGMRDFIWVLDPGNDDLQTTVGRLTDFGNALFAGTVVDFQCAGLSGTDGDIQLAAPDRRHLLLIFKEAMHNALKYSGAAKVRLDIRVTAQQLLMELRDDGKGFDTETASEGYGLKNMAARAAALNATLEISSGNSGTVVTLEMPLPHLRY